jgi:hypothetical protein
VNVVSSSQSLGGLLWCFTKGRLVTNSVDISSLGVSWGGMQQDICKRLNFFMEHSNFIREIRTFKGISEHINGTFELFMGKQGVALCLALAHLMHWEYEPTHRNIYSALSGHSQLKMSESVH